MKNDLEEVKLTTLSEYEVDYSFDVDEPQLPLGKHIVAEFCKKGAIDLTTWSRIYSVRRLKQQKLTKSEWSSLIIFLSTNLMVREICQFLIVLCREISSVCVCLKKN